MTHIIWETCKQSSRRSLTWSTRMEITDEEAAEVLCESFKEVFVIDNEEDAGMTEADTRKIPIHFERDKVQYLLLSLWKPLSHLDLLIYICLCFRDVPKKFFYRCLLYSRNPLLRVSYQLAVVSPIFKKGKKKCDAGNYRPVSLTSVPCEIMETMTKTELVKYLENSGVMSNSRFSPDLPKPDSPNRRILKKFIVWVNAVVLWKNRTL